jgi:hypothetical protein
MLAKQLRSIANFVLVQFKRARSHSTQSFANVVNDWAFTTRGERSGENSKLSPLHSLLPLHRTCMYTFRLRWGVSRWRLLIVQPKSQTRVSCWLDKTWFTTMGGDMGPGNKVRAARIMGIASGSSNYNISVPLVSPSLQEVLSPLLPPRMGARVSKNDEASNLTPAPSLAIMGAGVSKRIMGLRTSNWSASGNQHIARDVSLSTLWAALSSSMNEQSQLPSAHRLVTSIGGHRELNFINF